MQPNVTILKKKTTTETELLSFRQREDSLSKNGLEYYSQLTHNLPKQFQNASA